MNFQPTSMKSLLKKPILPLLLILLAAQSATAQQAADDLTFELRPKISAQDGPGVKISFEGKIYEGDWWESSILQEERSLAEDERLVIDNLAANRIGEAEEILALWAPAERSELSALMSNAELFRNNRKIFSDMEDSALIAKARYGGYTFFFVQHDSPGHASRINSYTVKKIGEEYFLTNELRDDPVFQYFTSAFTKNLPMRKK